MCQIEMSVSASEKLMTAKIFDFADKVDVQPTQFIIPSIARTSEIVNKIIIFFSIHEEIPSDVNHHNHNLIGFGFSIVR